MLELPRLLMRVLDGPGFIVRRITALIPLDLKNIDADRLLLSMAESDPDYLSYLNDEDLPRRRLRADVWQS